MNSEDWFRTIFSKSELEELNVTYEKIVYDFEHGLVVNIGLSNDMCLDLVEAWKNSHEGNLSAQLHMLNFMEGFINYLKDYLDNERNRI
jgi:hypothetical protein